jgi:hypothetical protein
MSSNSRKPKSLLELVNREMHYLSKSARKTPRRMRSSIRNGLKPVATAVFNAADDTDRFLKSVNNSVRRSIRRGKGGKSRRQTRKNNNRLTQRRKIEYINRQKRKTT